MAPHPCPPEARLWWLRYVILLEPVGRIGFVWTSTEPGPRRPLDRAHDLIFSCIVGIANYSIYQSSIDYTACSVRGGVYAVASKTGGNDFAREFLSGIAALYSTPMYSNIGKQYPLEWASTILAVIALFGTTPVFYFYKHSEEMRKRSTFAAQMAKEREEGRDEGLPHGDDRDKSAVAVCVRINRKIMCTSIQWHRGINGSTMGSRLGYSLMKCLNVNLVLANCDLEDATVPSRQMNRRR